MERCNDKREQKMRKIPTSNKLKDETKSSVKYFCVQRSPISDMAFLI